MYTILSTGILILFVKSSECTFHLQEIRHAWNYCKSCEVLYKEREIGLIKPVLYKEISASNNFPQTGYPARSRMSASFHIIFHQSQYKQPLSQ
jgi:hypothetical protein